MKYSWIADIASAVLVLVIDWTLHVRHVRLGIVARARCHGGHFGCCSLDVAVEVYVFFEVIFFTVVRIVDLRTRLKASTKAVHDYLLLCLKIQTTVRLDCKDRCARVRTGKYAMLVRLVYSCLVCSKEIGLLAVT